jgi:FlaA1/EpsC-like NDP-sugar epimerase
MGQPIRILDMARRFIRSNGLVPDADVQVQITGIRPGEKLYEELAYDSEDMSPTPHPSVRRWRTQPPDPARIRRIIARFDALRGSAQGSTGSHLWQNAGRDEILAALHEAVPEMVAPAVTSLQKAG